MAEDPTTFYALFRCFSCWRCMTLHLLLSECHSAVFPRLSVDQVMLRRNSLT